MAEISDIKQLRPELQSLSDKELERRMAEFQMEVDRRKAEKEREERAVEVELKNKIIDNYLNSLREMESNKLLPADIVAFYTNTNGGFTPHLKHKRLKA